MNGDRSYTVEDCLANSAEKDFPVVFDSFHNELNPSGFDAAEAIRRISVSWSRKDGIPMVDFSHHIPGDTSTKHAHTIDEDIFSKFLEVTKGYDFDIMLEIKDKELSALKAKRAAERDPRFMR